MLEVMGLVKRYGAVLALDGCSLNVPSGHLVGLPGPNGAGKTTVMRTLFGLVVPDADTVRRRGRPVDTRAQQSCTPAPGCASAKPGAAGRPGRSRPGARKRGLPCPRRRR
jgi:ABC-type branched-subunit amino acid transport system ATPase component